MMEYSRVVAASKEKNYLKKRVQSTEEKPFGTGKDAGATNAAKQFKKTHPHLTFGESTAWKLRDWYNGITKQKGAVDNKMTRLKRGRPLLLGAVLDEKVKHFFTTNRKTKTSKLLIVLVFLSDMTNTSLFNFLIQLRKKGGVVDAVAAVATTKQRYYRVTR